MTPFTIMQMLLAVLANTGATLLLRTASTSGGASLISRSTITHGGGALFLYGGSFVLYALILRKLPPFVAYAIITFGTQILLTWLAFSSSAPNSKATMLDLIALGFIATGLITLAASHAR
jgi:multidrug transporter EmrE-like cation transporter